jgi:hypothetical protein
VFVIEKLDYSLLSIEDDATEASVRAETVAQFEEWVGSFNVFELLNEAAGLLQLPKADLITTGKERYLAQVDNWGWLYRVLRYSGPETDDRLGRERGRSQISDSIHRPDSINHPFDSGETSSWSFTMRPRLRKLWVALRVLTTRILTEAESSEEAWNRLQEVASSVEARKNRAVMAYAEIMDLNPENVFITGSGAAAIQVFRELFGGGSQLSTTNENGGEVTSGIKKEDLISLRFDDPDNINQTNVSRTHEEVAQKYIDDITKGKRVISFTICSKSGLRYDQSIEGQPSALDLVMAAVAEHNENDPDDQVYVVADIVQLAGRTPLSEIKDIINDHRFIGAAHSGSKSAGGSPHMGLLALNEYGAWVLNEKQTTVSEDKVREYQLVSAASHQPISPDLLTQVRTIDNIEALLEAEEILNHEDYQHVVEALNAVYTDIFTACGFTVLDNQTPTIIAMEPPKRIAIENVDKKLLTKLAEQGISCGGFLKEGRIPILRFGISIELVRMVLSGQLAIESDEFKIIKEKFKQRVITAVAAA